MTGTAAGSTAAPEVLGPIASAASMAAIVEDRYGTADALELRDVAIPTIAADEVLVRVRAPGWIAGSGIS